MRKEPLLEVGNLYLYCPFIIFKGEHFMKAIGRLSVIRHKSKINKDWKYKYLFQIFNKDEIWISAYKNIRNNKILLLPTITKKTLDLITLKRLKKLREKVSNQSYQFKTTHETKIIKINNKKNSLKLFIANDKIVQEVIRIIVIKIYEPCFKKQNFKTHDILEYVELKFQWVDWVIEGIYSTINNKQFYKILSKKIKDVNFLNIIYKLIKCKILSQNMFIWSNFGVLQKNTLSEIFINIYYNELDKWIQKKVEILNQFYINKQNQTCKELSYYTDKKIDQLKKQNKNLKIYKIFLKKFKIVKNKKLTINNLATKPVQIEYVRYENDWILGISENQILAKRLRIEVNLFVSLKLKQIIYPIKTNIINLWIDKINFLGYNIYFSQNKKVCKTKIKLKFDIPLNLIFKIMEKKSYIKNFVKGHRSISKTNYTTLNDIVIIKHFMQVQLGLINYYSGCNDITKLQLINYFLHLSCVMTLTQKHRSSIKKIFIKHKKLFALSKNKINTNFLPQKTWKNKLNFIDPFHIYTNENS